MPIRNPAHKQPLREQFDRPAIVTGAIPKTLAEDIKRMEEAEKNKGIAMSLHDKIMNLPGKPGMYVLDRGRHIAYYEGHRDARHAAAELAVKQDALVAQLVEALERIRDLDVALDLYDAKAIARAALDFSAAPEKSELALKYAEGPCFGQNWN